VPDGEGQAWSPTGDETEAEERDDHEGRDQRGGRDFQEVVFLSGLEDEPEEPDEADRQRPPAQEDGRRVRASRARPSHQTAARLQFSLEQRVGVHPPDQ
jgi:hypothetical protein